MLSGGNTNIHEAAFSGDVRRVRDLLEHDEEVTEEKDEFGQIALHKAAMNGWLDLVRILVERGSNVALGDVAGCTALHLAAANGYVEVCRYLVEEGAADVKHESKKGQTPRYMAKTRSQHKTVSFFNEQENKLQGNSWFNM